MSPRPPAAPASPPSRTRAPGSSRRSPSWPRTRSSSTRATAAVIVRAHVVGLEEAQTPEPPREHDPHWWIATLEADLVAKGDAPGLGEGGGTVAVAVRQQPRRPVARPAQAEGRARAACGCCTAADDELAQLAPFQLIHQRGPAAQHPARRSCASAGIGDNDAGNRREHDPAQSSAARRSRTASPTSRSTRRTRSRSSRTAFTPDPTERAARAGLRLHGRRRDVVAALDRAGQGRAHAPTSASASATAGGALYAGTLNFTTSNLNVLRTANPFAVTPMTAARRPRGRGPALGRPPRRPARAPAQRPGLRRATTTSTPAPPDRLGRALAGRARPPPRPAGFAAAAVERRTNVGQDGPPVRTAAHPDGTVYAAFQRWVKHLPSGPHDLAIDVVVVRDDNWGGGPTPFRDLADPGDGTPGQARRQEPLHPLHREHRAARPGAHRRRPRHRRRPARTPTTSGSPGATAWAAPPGTDWTMHVRRSTNRGQTWGNRPCARSRTRRTPRSPSTRTGVSA